MTCEECKERRQQIPYVVHESAMARSERTIKRLWITVLLLIVMLVGTNGVWLWYESQFEEVTTTIETEQDGSGVNIVGGGDISYYEPEGENNN